MKYSNSYKELNKKLLLKFLKKYPTPVGPSPIKPDLKNTQAMHLFHRCYWSLKAEPSRHQSQIKTCVRLQL